MTFCPLPKVFHVTFLLVRVGGTHLSLGPGCHWLQWIPPKYQPAPPQPWGKNELCSWWPGLPVRDHVLYLVTYILFESTGARNASIPLPALTQPSVSL